jgi:hypothetical protein
VSALIFKANKYGVVLKTRRPKQKPVSMDLSSEEGGRVWRDAVRRVMATHANVIHALAER